MDQVARSALPTSRLARRRATPRTGLVVVGVALLVNLVVLAVLSRLSAVHRVPAPPAVVALSVRQVPPPAPSVADEPAAEPQPEAAVEVAVPVIPMPALDLPAIGSSDGLELPALSPGDAPPALPLVVPAFSTVAPPVGGDALGLPVAAPPIDEPARILGGVDLERFYPKEAKRRGVEGETRITLTIGVDDRVTACTVLTSTPPGVFEQAAADLGPTIRCIAAKRDGRPVVSTVTQTIVWTIRKR